MNLTGESPTPNTVPSVPNSCPEELRGEWKALCERIAEYEKNEKSLLESKRLLRDITEQSLVGIYVLSKGRFVFVNNAFAEITGYSVEEVRNWGPEQFSQYIHPEDRAFVVEQARRKQEGKGDVATQYEFRGIHKSGEIHWYSIRSKSIPFNGEHAILAVLVDVTVRKEAEEALRKSEERFKEAQRLARMGSWEADLTSGKIYWSDELYRLFGYDPEKEEITIEKFLSAIHPDDREMMDRRIQGIQQGQGEGSGPEDPYFSEYRILLPDGSVRFMRGEGKVERDENGAPLRFVGIAQDVTERWMQEEKQRTLEAQMQHVQKLESLGVLAGGIAHDFNNLLTGILGHASLLKNDLSNDADALRHVDQIEVITQRSADLARQMLDYSGKGRFVVKPLSLSTTVDELAHLLQASISKMATLKCEFAKELPLINADPVQIQQVVMNLITNASDAIGENEGTITVKTGTVQADRKYLSANYLESELPEGRYVFMEVSDTGCGMDKGTLTKIFDPFFTTKFTGRGLGLSAVLGIVHGHRGVLRIYSEPNKGTTIRVCFPSIEIARQKEVGAESPDVSSDLDEWRGEGTILVADDEEAILSLVKEILQDRGFDVLTAGDGKEALAMFEEHQNEICLVLLDLTMPKLSGREAFAEIARRRPEIPVVLSSGYTQQVVVEAFGDEPPAGFLPKPYRANTLVERIRSVLDART